MTDALPATYSPAVLRFIDLMDRWCLTLNKLAYGPMAHLVLLLVKHLRAIKADVLRIVALVDAGKWKDYAPRKRAATRPPPDPAELSNRSGPADAADPSATRGKSPFEITLGWMCKLGPYISGGFGEAIYGLLMEPEWVAYMAKAPRIGDLMRKLLHGTGYSSKPCFVYPVPPSARTRRRQYQEAAAAAAPSPDASSAEAPQAASDPVAPAESTSQPQPRRTALKRPRVRAPSAAPPPDLPEFAKA